MVARAPPEIPAIGAHAAFRTLLDDTSRWAKVVRPVLIQGERGSGKELIAARLHYLSPRWQGAYVTLNCGAVSESLMDAELFGAEAGAYTGALKSRAGRLERADGGTLFLDEIASMPMMMQEKLLRFMEYGELERLGGSRTLSVDVRIVAASNVDLLSLARRGDFRPDLLDRLAFEVLTVPPLRARGQDILLLAEHFARGAAHEGGMGVFAGFSPEVEATLLEHDWPGNVRELKNVVERSVFCHCHEEKPEDRPLGTIQLDPFASPFRPAGRLVPTAGSEEAEPPRTLERAADQPDDLRQAVAAFEAGRIREALEASRFHIRSAAERLGLNYHQLRHLMKKHRISNQHIN